MGGGQASGARPPGANSPARSPGGGPPSPNSLRLTAEDRSSIDDALRQARGTLGDGAAPSEMLAWALSAVSRQSLSRAPGNRAARLTQEEVDDALRQAVDVRADADGAARDVREREGLLVPAPHTERAISMQSTCTQHAIQHLVIQNNVKYKILTKLPNLFKGSR